MDTPNERAFLNQAMVNPNMAVQNMGGMNTSSQREYLNQAMANPNAAAQMANPMQNMSMPNMAQYGAASPVERAYLAQALNIPTPRPNFANDEMPLYMGGLLENPQGQMIDPQELYNKALDMSQDPAVRAAAVEQLRALGLEQ